jgi:hypothetical protein
MGALLAGVFCGVGAAMSFLFGIAAMSEDGGREVMYVYGVTGVVGC